MCCLDINQMLSCASILLSQISVNHRPTQAFSACYYRQIAKFSFLSLSRSLALSLSLSFMHSFVCFILFIHLLDLFYLTFTFISLFSVERLVWWLPPMCFAWDYTLCKRFVTSWVKSVRQMMFVVKMWIIYTMIALFSLVLISHCA